MYIQHQQLYGEHIDREEVRQRFPQIPSPQNMVGDHDAMYIRNKAGSKGLGYAGYVTEAD